MNVWTFTGNLGDDCRVGVAGDTPVCNFSVAVASGYGKHKSTVWVDCGYFGKGGEAVAPYLKKGQTVAVSGEVSMKPATDKYPAKIAVRVNSLTLVGGKKDEGQQKQEDAKSEDDLPF